MNLLTVIQKKHHVCFKAQALVLEHSVSERENYKMRKVKYIRLKRVHYLLNRGACDCKRTNTVLRNSYIYLPI